MTTPTNPAAATDPIEAAMTRALTTQGPAMEENFTAPDWVMSPAEFRAFWRSPRLAAFSTLGAGGRMHASPVDVSFEANEFAVLSFSAAVRVRDVEANRHVVITTWDDAWHATIIYGEARLADRAAEMVRILVKPQRIYAIRAPAGHQAHRAGTFDAERPQPGP